MKLIKDLGVISKNGGKRERFGIYECPDCLLPTEARAGAVKAKTVKRCYICGRNLSKKTQTKHGQSKTRLYVNWQTMISRCTNPNSKSYANYGGRGITIYKPWFIFTNYYTWAINNGYTEKLTIERLKVNENYIPENCSFIPIEEQPLNKRDSIKNRFSIEIQNNIINEYATTTITKKQLSINYKVSEHSMRKLLNGQYL